MQISQNAHLQLEFFFREFYQDENLKLPKIEIYGRRGARFVSKMTSVYAITFGRFIFVRPELLNRNSVNELCISKELLAHETTHVLQYQKLGWFGFFYTYLKGYWKALKQKEKWDFKSRTEAYLEIPHEIEARICGSEFVKWNRKKKNNFNYEKA